MMTPGNSTLPRVCVGMALVLALGGGCVSAVRADHEDRKSKTEVDIKSLKAELHRSDGEWALRLKYDVEIKDAYRDDRFELVLYVSEKGRVLHDEDGEPIEWVVELDQPSKVDDDELEFKDRLTVYLPDYAIANPKRLRINGAVYQEGYELPLNRKIKSVKYKPKKHSTYRVGSVLGGVSFSYSSGHSYRSHYSRYRGHSHFSRYGRGGRIRIGYSRSRCR